MLDEPECAAWFECYNLTQHDAGDHKIFIGQVERCHRSFGQPLVYHAGDFDLTPSTEPLSSNKGLSTNYFDIENYGSRYRLYCPWCRLCRALGGSRACCKRVVEGR